MKNLEMFLESTLRQRKELSSSALADLWNESYKQSVSARQVAKLMSKKSQFSHDVRTKMWRLK